jgi:hypothetical protein
MKGGPITVNRIEHRSLYTDRYGRDAWARAVYLAGSHRRRAVTEYGLLEHWTAPEWLDLCATWDMKCPRCQEAKRLTPHHRVSMSENGSNLIANILPLCEKCHWWVEDIACAEDWLERQNALCETLKPGVQVFWAVRNSHRGPVLLTIAEVTPPVPMTVAPPVIVQGINMGCRKSGLVVVGRELTEWAGAWARTTEDGPDIGYEAEELIPYTADTFAVWLQHREAERMAWRFRVPRRRKGQRRDGIRKS